MYIFWGSLCCCEHVRDIETCRWWWGASIAARSSKKNKSCHFGLIIITENSCRFFKSYTRVDKSAMIPSHFDMIVRPCNIVFEWTHLAFYMTGSAFLKESPLSALNPRGHQLMHWRSPIQHNGESFIFHPIDALVFSNFSKPCTCSFAEFLRICPSCITTV